MPQVSKYPLAKSTQDRLYHLFLRTIVELKEPIKAEEFFNDLLTPTEKVMLAKRLAIAVMLLKGYDYVSIREVLKVSPGTIGAISMWLKYSGSGYRKALERLIKKEKIDNIFKSIDQITKELKPERTFNKVLSKGYPEGKLKEPF